MASLPSQASRRRSHPTEQTSFPPTQDSSSREAETSEPQSMPLNNPQASAETASAPTAPEPPKAQPQQDDSRICWICQQDDTEDRPEDGEWRSPCSCSLTAHEPCLLEWIADQEAPKPGQYNLISSSKLTCPQCKGEIKVKRPRAPIVELYIEIQRLARALILPTALSGLMGCVYSGLLVYGLNTTYMVFGTDAARSLLGPGIVVARINPHTWKGVVGRALHAMDPFFPATLYTDNYKLFFALPMVGPGLVLLRTSLADQASALLLPIYFANSINKHPHWTSAIRSPPTPALVFATIPFLKKAYNALYHYTFSDLEREWDRAVQRKPREGETAEQIEQQAANEEGEAIFDVEFIHEEVDIPEGNNAPAQEPGQAEPNAGAVERENAQRPQVLNRWAMRQDISVVHVITTVMGALFFPTVSSVMGDVLKVALPPKWIERAGKGGILKEKWGRTVVGGCLFVVLKDMVTLYVKWRRARDFGKRKVLDYVGKKGARGGKK